MKQRTEKTTLRDCMLRWVLVMALVVTMLPALGLRTVKADTLETVHIRVTYGQTEAQLMFANINSLRTTSSAGTSRAYAYDYQLEQAAMQRAAELALINGATRPNGTPYYTVYAEKGISNTNYAENTAAGYASAAEVLQIWSNGQVQRDNLLSSAYTAVGIGHVIYNGVHYWTAEFGTTSGTSNPAAPNNSTDTVAISLLSSYINSSSISTTLGNALTMCIGETKNISDVSMALQLNGHYPAGTNCPLSDPVRMTVNDPVYATLNGNMLTAIREGQTYLTVSAGQVQQIVTLSIVKPTFDNAVIEPIPDQSYTGYALQPSLVVRIGNTILRENSDYSVMYYNNTNMGTAMVMVTGLGTYSGNTKNATFRITGPSVANATVSAIPNQPYTGYDVCPVPVVYLNNVLLRQGIDYTVSYQNNRNIGTATMILTGTGTYGGTKNVTFYITGSNISGASVDTIPSQAYTGNAIMPTVVVKYNNIVLRLNTDYTVSYSNNVNVGTATVTITGRGTYSGTKTVNFQITGKDISSASVSGVQTMPYTGYDQCPSITVTYNGTVLTQGVDYNLAYRNNREPGTASIDITGCGSYSGSKTVTFKIQNSSLAGASVTVANQVYDGSEQYPSVTVKLNGTKLYEDTDYSVEYSSNIKPGRAKVTIYGQGEYSGTKTAYFIIKPKKATLSSVKKSGKAAVLTWKKDSTVTGYEVFRSKKKTSGFTKVAIATSKSTVKYTNKSLSSGTYYYKVRSYKTINGTKYYGAYSTVKSVKI